MKYTTLVIQGEHSLMREMDLGKVIVATGAHYNAIQAFDEITEFVESIIEGKYDSIDEAKDAATAFMMRGNE